MSNAGRDENRVTTLVGLSSSDGVTVVPIYADPTTHRLYCDVSISSVTVSGGKTNNNAAPGATNIGALVGVATAAAPTYTEGNLIALSTDLAGALRVTGSLSVGGTTDNSAFTAGTSTGTPTMGFYHSTIDTVTDGRAAAVAITSKRAMMVNLQNASGTEIGTSATPVQVTLANTGANATAVKVDGSAVTQPVSGTVTANAGTNLNTSALALESGGNLATIASSVVAQGTALGSTKVSLAGASVTTNAPTFTTGQVNQLSMTPAGGLRIDLKDTAANTNNLNVNLAASAATVTVSATNLSTNIAQMNGVAVSMGTGIMGTGVQRVAIASDNDPITVKQAPGTNLHMVVDSGTITTVSAVTAITNALPAGTNLMGKVGLDQTTPGTTNAVALAQIGSTTVVTGGVAGTLAVGGNVATNVAIGTNPINNGAQGVSSENSAVTTGRMVQLVADLVGKLIVLPYANPENFTDGTTAAITDTTTTSVIAAQGAGIRTYITQITVTNSHATVGTFVKITDGASTIKHEGYAAAAGGGYTASFPTPLRCTANTAVNAICVTTGANVIASVSGYKGA
jgi:hypothetical protein